MTITEAKDVLLNRLSFDGADASTRLSGRYYEGEHAIITKDNIRDVQPTVNITDTQFDAYLLKLEEENIYEVLADVTDKDYLNDDLLTIYPSIFDKAISKGMAVKVIELILSTTRSNHRERILGANSAKVIWDLNGSYANNNGDIQFARKKGIAYEYEQEIKRIKAKTGDQRKIHSHTMGNTHIVTSRNKHFRSGSTTQN